jgi:hypothetical protein
VRRKAGPDERERYHPDAVLRYLQSACLLVSIGCYIRGRRFFLLSASLVSVCSFFRCRHYRVSHAIVRLAKTGRFPFEPRQHDGLIRKSGAGGLREKARFRGDEERIFELSRVRDREPGVDLQPEWRSGPRRPLQIALGQLCGSLLRAAHHAGSGPAGIRQGSE